MKEKELQQTIATTPEEIWLNQHDFTQVGLGILFWLWLKQQETTKKEEQ